MTDTLARPVGASVRGEASARQRSGVARDTSVDAIRIALLVVVFALHAMMFGVTMGPDGPVLENALENQAWFAPVSWVVQVMPLFFIAGGFSSLHHWRSMRSRGATPADYVRGRLGRLVRPVIAVVVVVAAGLVALSIAGVPADVVATAGFRIGQPLWFLAVYVGLSALVPLTVRAHERARVLTPLALLGAVVAVDVTRLSTGIEAIGLANLLLVWLLVQQLGFHLADGGLDRLSRRTLWGIAGGALSLLAVLTVIGPYPVDMYDNLNPPTVGLVVLGVAQLALFQLTRPRIRAWVGRADASRAIAALGDRAMTVYLWHMPVLVALAGVLLVANATFGFALPEPLSAAWWASRPLWLGVGAAAVVPVVLVFARFERGRRMSRTGSPAASAAPSNRPTAAAAWSTAFDAACGVAGVAVVLVAGFGPLQAVVALALLAIALRGSGPLLAAVQRRSR
ncbi:acyltransferase [Agromyces sp. H66]|uniref:acyltransferase family protein n=1 Tax=Agromyces sp. H66 TaxID=2529859 RepID=UPI0010AAF416|nr:acyltransferase [Agromyces sp. H66]